MAIVGDTVKLKAEFKDFDGTLTSPDDVKLIVYDWNKEIIEEYTVSPVEEGKYEQAYTIKDTGAAYFEFSGQIDGYPVARRCYFERRWA